MRCALLSYALEKQCDLWYTAAVLYKERSPVL